MKPASKAGAEVKIAWVPPVRANGVFITLYHVVSVILANAESILGHLLRRKSLAQHIVVSHANYAILE